MSTWFEKLKDIINIKIDKINFSLVNINYTDNSTNKKAHHFDQKTQTLEISLDKLDAKQFEALKVLNKENIQNGGYVLEKESSTLLDKLYSFNEDENEYRKHLNFFKGIIDDEDYQALELSYFLRSDFLSDGNNVNRYKRDIRNQFGKRGNNIANLCTAGYFEELLIPMYNEAPESFDSVYELLVVQEAFTLFIHGGMKPADITSRLRNKIELAKRYGLSYFMIHSKGKRNEKTITKCL